MTYRIRFWYWQQEVVLTGITAEEIVASVYFNEDYDHPVEWFNRRAWVTGAGGKRYEIEVTISEDDPSQLMIGHIKEGTEDTIDVDLGDNGGWSFLDSSYWILEAEEQRWVGAVDLGDSAGDYTTINVYEKKYDEEESRTASHSDNGRVYPKEVINEAIEEFNERIKNGELLGEIVHPCEGLEGEPSQEEAKEIKIEHHNFRRNPDKFYKHGNHRL